MIVDLVDDQVCVTRNKKETTMKFNRKVAKALVAAVLSVLVVLGVSNADKIGAVLNAAAEFAPEAVPEAPAPAGDAGAAGAPVVAADAGL